MADNKKKPKLSFADQLKEQASKVAPSKVDQRSKETVLVNIGGEMVPIARGDMDEATWAKVKARAASDAPKPKQELQLPVEISADRPVSKLTEDETEPEATPTVKVVDQKPDQGTPDEWKSPEPSMKKTGGTQTEEDTFVGSRPGSVQGRVASMMMGGIPGVNPGGALYQKTPLDKAREDVGTAVDAMNADAMSNQKLADAPLERQINQQALALEAQNAVDTMSAQGRANQNAARVGESAMNVPPADNMVNPPVDQPSLVEQIDQTAGQFGQALRDVVTNPVETLGSAAGTVRRFLAGPEQAPSDQIPEQSPVKTGFPQHTPGHPGPGQPSNVSISGKVPGQGVAPQSQIDDPVATLRKEAELQAEAQRLMAGNLSEKVKADAEILRTQQVERAKLDADRQKELVAQQAEMQKYESGLRDLQAQVLDLSKQTINPNQFYDSMDTGQRVSSVIAGALFGFTGQGMQWLQRLDSLAERSVQAQAADLNRKRGLLSDATQIQGNLVAMAEKRGLQGKAAYDAALISLKENIATQLDMNAMNFAQPDLKLKSQMMASQIRQGLAKDIASYQTQAQHAAMDARLKQAQINHLNAQSFKLSAGEGGGKPKSVSPTLAARVANTRQMIATLQNMKELAQNSGIFDRLGRMGKEQLSSTEKAKLDQYDAGRFEVARLRAGSSLQKPEQEALLPLIAPRSGRFDPVPGLDEAIKRAETALKIEEETAAGATTGDVSVPGGSGGGDFPETVVE